MVFTINDTELSGSGTVSLQIEPSVLCALPHRRPNWGQVRYVAAKHATCPRPPMGSDKHNRFPKNKEEWVKRFRLAIHLLEEEMTFVDSRIAAVASYGNAPLIVPESAARQYFDEHCSSLRVA
jgi:hypothetical protein